MPRLRPRPGSGEGGFGLLELMVVMGLFGVVAMGITSLVTALSKSGKTADQTLQASILLSSVQLNLESGDACRSLFRTVVFNPLPGSPNPPIDLTDLSTLPAGSTQPIVLLARNVSYSGLMATQIQLVRDDLPINATPLIEGSVTYNVYNFKLGVQLTRAQNTGYGPPVLNKEFRGVMGVNQADGTIFNCNADRATDPRQMCLAMGGQWDATKTPKCSLFANEYESHVVVGNGSFASCPANEVLTGGGARNNGAKDTHATYPCGGNAWCCTIEKPGECYAVCLRRKVP